jgi:hypothetical protein
MMPLAEIKQNGWAKISSSQLSSQSPDHIPSAPIGVISGCVRAKMEFNLIDDDVADLRPVHTGQCNAFINCRVKVCGIDLGLSRIP